jgi:hypothetical protein
MVFAIVVTEATRFACFFVVSAGMLLLASVNVLARASVPLVAAPFPCLTFCLFSGRLCRDQLAPTLARAPAAIGEEILCQPSNVMNLEWDCKLSL